MPLIWQQYSMHLGYIRVQNKYSSRFSLPYILRDLHVHISSFHLSPELQIHLLPIGHLNTLKAPQIQMPKMELIRLGDKIMSSMSPTSRMVSTSFHLRNREMREKCMIYKYQSTSLHLHCHHHSPSYTISLGPLGWVFLNPLFP